MGVFLSFRTIGRQVNLPNRISYFGLLTHNFHQAISRDIGFVGTFHVCIAGRLCYKRKGKETTLSIHIV